MTQEDWKKAEQKLIPPFGYAKFQIDGYNVSVGTVRTSTTKFSYMIYVDGEFRGEWLSEDCEIRRRFCYEGRKNILTGKSRTDFIKEFGKREYNRFVKANPEKVFYSYFTPYFGSFRTMKAHFIKNNTSITLVK